MWKFALLLGKIFLKPVKKYINSLSKKMEGFVKFYFKSS